MKALKEPRWHPSKYANLRFQSRRVVDLPGHSIILNSNVEPRLLAAAGEAFEIADEQGHLLAVTWSTPNLAPAQWSHERQRNRSTWHIRTADLKSLEPERSRRGAANAVMLREWKAKRSAEAKRRAADMSALADIII